jgi:hypothetical protein
MDNLEINHMFEMGQLQGILLTLARPELTIYANEKKHIGYEVRVRVIFRANSMSFIESLNDSLRAFHVESTIKERESKIRPKPMLRVSGIENLRILCGLVPDKPDSKRQWKNFTLAVGIIFNGEHTTQEGLDELLRLKGEI